MCLELSPLRYKKGDIWDDPEPIKLDSSVCWASLWVSQDSYLKKGSTLEKPGQVTTLDGCRNIDGVLLTSKLQLVNP